VLEVVEPLLSDEDGGYVIDWHIADIFDPDHIDLAVVLRASTEMLFDRLRERTEYPQSKIDENMDAEIMQVVLDEAREAYGEEHVVELQSNTEADLDSNLQRLQLWVEQWQKEQPPASPRKRPES